MQILTQQGRVLPVKRVVALVEQMVRMNGKKFLLMATAKNLSVQPTALAFEMDDSSNGPFGPSVNSEMVVGNLKAEKVVEILKTLNEKGAYDLNALPMQKVQKVEQLNIDGGESAAYSSDMIAGCSFGFGMHRFYTDTFHSTPVIVNQGLSNIPLSDMCSSEDDLDSLDEGEESWEEEGLDE